MRNYNATNTEEKESYQEFKDRKELDWKERVRTICIEVKDSSLKEIDKERFIVSLSRKILNNDLRHENWRD